MIKFELVVPLDMKAETYFEFFILLFEVFIFITVTLGELIDLDIVLIYLVKNLQQQVKFINVIFLGGAKRLSQTFN